MKIVPNLNIGRLSLDLPARWGGCGEDLGRMIADRLAGEWSGQGSRSVYSMQLNVAARPGDSKDAVAEWIAAEIVRQLRRAS